MNDELYKMRESSYTREIALSDELMSQMRFLLTRIRDQEKRKEEFHEELIHPYVVVLHSWFKSLDLVREVMKYLPEKYCQQCKELYLGSPCLYCSEPIRISPSVTWKLLGSLNLVTNFSYMSGETYTVHRYCYAASNEDDAKIIQYWKKYQVYKPNKCNCDEVRDSHLGFYFSSRNSDNDILSRLPDRYPQHSVLSHDNVGGISITGEEEAMAYLSYEEAKKLLKKCFHQMEKTNKDVLLL